jgi:hypothetical protein
MLSVWYGLCGIWTVALIVMLIVGSAQAHDWYPHQCCHDTDCHPVGCDTLAENGDGSVTYTSDLHVTFEFEKRKVKASQDSKCHVCIHSSPMQVPVTPLCVFIQQSY